MRTYLVKNQKIKIWSKNKKVEGDIKMEPIRILHIVQRMEAGGTQAFLMNLYRNIDRTKVQFDFFVEYEEKEFYDDEIKKLGGRIYYTNFRKTLNVFELKKSLKKVLMDHPEYKIIHIHATAIGHFCTDVAKKCKVPVIIAHTHNNGAVKDWKYYPKIILRKLYTNGPTDFFACSEEAGKYTFKDKNFTVIHNSIDAKKFLYNSEIRDEVRNTFGLKDSFVIGNVGRLHEQKNQKFLIDLFVKIKEQQEKSKLILIGSGPLESELKRQVELLNLKNDVIFLGNRSDMERIYQAMDVFVLPSLFEGLGIVAIEAQAAGLPVICSNGVSREANVTNNIHRLDLNDDPEKWINKILNTKVEDKEGILDDIKKHGYDIEENAKKIQEFYLRKYEKC